MIILTQQYYQQANVTAQSALSTLTEDVLAMHTFIFNTQTKHLLQTLVTLYSVY